MNLMKTKPRKTSLMKRKFSERVYALTKKIPQGKVSTYKEIAKAMKTKGYRAVGNALHRNPMLIVTPCHRVVKGDGSVGGFILRKKNKIKLLRNEGIEIKCNKIVDFKEKLFTFDKKN